MFQLPLLLLLLPRDVTSGPNKVSAKVQIIREHASDNVTSVSQIVELLSFDIDTQKATGIFFPSYPQWIFCRQASQFAKAKCTKQGEERRHLKALSPNVNLSQYENWGRLAYRLQLQLSWVIAARTTPAEEWNAAEKSSGIYKYFKYLHPFKSASAFQFKVLTLCLFEFVSWARSFEQLFSAQCDDWPLSAARVWEPGIHRGAPDRVTAGN